MKYFIDYSEDEFLPSAGDSALVKKYETLSDAVSMWIIVCDSKESMYKTASEFISQARHRTQNFKEFTNEEMYEKIRKLEK